MTRWAMVADLERCVGCQTCTAACRHTNATAPAVQWRRVIDVEAGAYPEVSRSFVPVGCQHCAEPPCMYVCPTGATFRRADGVIGIDYSICIGCAYCIVACPYQARFLEHEPHYAYGAVMQNEVERADFDRMGVAQKCTFCSDRIDFGLANDLTPGIDPRATPACANACIADALHFGDLDDPNSNVSRLLREHRSFRMHAELGTAPGFHYLYGHGPDPATDDPPVIGDSEVGHLRSRAAGPALQQHWDWKAAANFICGGLGSGLFIATAVASLRYGGLEPIGWTSLVIVAAGLSLLLLKIGRPLRALNVLRQPRWSWMSREAWIAGGFFPLAMYGLWASSSPFILGAAVLALCFLVSQAMILYAAKGIPAWRNARIVPLIVSTGLGEGSGLFLITAALSSVVTPTLGIAAAMTAVLATLRGLLWRSYLSALQREGAPSQTLAILSNFSPWLLIGGLALPLLLIAIGYLAPQAAAALDAVAGLCVAAAGVALKFILVTRAAFNQGFALARTPTRGFGAAGTGTKPGWSHS